MGYRNILVPLDGSAIAQTALEEAVKLAKISDGTINLLTVIETPVMQLEGYGEVVGTMDVHEILSGKYKEMLAREAEKLKEEGTEATWSLREGHPHEEVVKACEEGDIDIVVMTTHGRTGISHFIMGSVAERVVRTAPCPVLIVRKKQ